ncbi:MAG: bifunctional DNA-formamidopyrimidine glycosylase/DNA-(apurinic or apyrimidinic site) lyase [Methylobacteriaceae bacterium]|jgi:formamidopyrimidine-DNA glycosylase|nr:bifunctional DNA-formamidopyrimidine glycosylase/DNA-(apurinic or apyrimidinic site) lyase [Methylobacteriaceae bacterium]
MPELPEVETIRRGLEPVLLNRRIAGVTVKRDGLRYPFPPGFAHRLQGRAVTALTRRAKFMLAALEGGETLIIHLGMSGSFLVEKTITDADSAERRHDHVVLHLSDGPFISYRDPRRFGFMDLTATADVPNSRHLSALGIEPLADDFTGGALQRLFHKKSAPVKAALLDQRLVAGLGNIYVCEALYDAGLHPARAAASLTDTEAARLAGCIRDVLNRALKAGGSTLKDYRRADGSGGYFQHDFRVYDREGCPCPRPGCRGTVRRMVQSGRSTFFCDRCQPEGRERVQG